MPEEGVRRLVQGLGKGSASRVQREVFDEDDVVTTRSRTAPGSQDLQLYDVLRLAQMESMGLDEEEVVDVLLPESLAGLCL